MAEVIDELESVSGSSAQPVGCAVLLYDYFNCDIIECMAVRRRCHRHKTGTAGPDCVYLSGDGDLAAIGTAETIHAANRGENITIILSTTPFME